MEKQETTYISKLIPKDLLPLLLQQLWWKGFDEAQKKFPNEDASNVAVRRLIKRMFTEFDEDATRKQIDNALEDYANFKLWESRQDWKDDFDRKGNLANEKQMHVDKLLALLGGTTNGK